MMRAPNDDQPQERWRPVPIPGCAGFYRVSDHGHVLSLYTGHILKTQMRKGYMVVTMRSVDNQNISASLGRLVLRAFCPIQQTRSFSVSWVNDDKTDNHLSNLKWKPWRTTAKLSDDDVRDIRARWMDGETGAELSREYKVSHVAISRVVSGITYQLVL